MVLRAPWFHLARRFVATVLGRFEPENQRIIETYLTGPERALFNTMTSADRRHCVDLYEQLQRDGHRDPDLLRAALLHDVGKATARIPVAVRVVYTLAALLSPRAADWLAFSDVGWRRPFFVVTHHARLGADAALLAGSGSKVADLIAGHGARGTDVLSQTLYDYDRRM